MNKTGVGTSHLRAFVRCPDFNECGMVKESNHVTKYSDEVHMRVHCVASPPNCNTGYCAIYMYMYMYMYISHMHICTCI